MTKKLPKAKVNREWNPKSKLFLDLAKQLKEFYDADPSPRMVKALANKHGLSVRSIYRYLNLAGVRFYLIRDKKGKFKTY